MKLLLFITGIILFLKILDIAYYAGFHAGLKAMRDRCEKYLEERRNK